MAPERFVVDIMLGRLVRWLRAMGYDSLFPAPAAGSAGDRRLLGIARAESRVLLTRDRVLARLAEPRGMLVRAERVDAQIAEVVAALGLAPPASAWLTRCLDCNALLEARERGAVHGRVPEHVLATAPGFRACPACAKVYWAGSHADRMVERLGRLLGLATSGSEDAGRPPPDAGSP